MNSSQKYQLLDCISQQSITSGKNACIHGGKHKWSTCVSRPLPQPSVVNFGYITSAVSLLEWLPSPVCVNKARERTKRTIKRLSDGIKRNRGKNWELLSVHGWSFAWWGNGNLACWLNFWVSREDNSKLFKEDVKTYSQVSSVKIRYGLVKTCLQSYLENNILKKKSQQLSMR